jgi:hypothetical protein
LSFRFVGAGATTAAADAPASPAGAWDLALGLVLVLKLVMEHALVLVLSIRMVNHRTTFHCSHGPVCSKRLHSHSQCACVLLTDAQINAARVQVEAKGGRFTGSVRLYALKICEYKLSLKITDTPTQRL